MVYAMSKGIFDKYMLYNFQDEYFKRMQAPNPLFLKRLHDWFFSKCIRFSDVLVIQEKPRLELLCKTLKMDFSFLDIFFSFCLN